MLLFQLFLQRHYGCVPLFILLRCRPQICSLLVGTVGFPNSLNFLNLFLFVLLSLRRSMLCCSPPSQTMAAAASPATDTTLFHRTSGSRARTRQHARTPEPLVARSGRSRILAIHTPVSSAAVWGSAPGLVNPTSLFSLPPRDQQHYSMRTGIIYCIDIDRTFAPLQMMHDRRNKSTQGT